MEIERVVTTVALKIGRKVWPKGEVFFPPFSAGIRNEIKHNAKTLRIFYKKEPLILPTEKPSDVPVKKKRKPVKRKLAVKKEKRLLKKRTKSKTSKPTT